jgi:cytochrome c
MVAETRRNDAKTQSALKVGGRSVFLCASGPSRRGLLCALLVAALSAGCGELETEQVTAGDAKAGRAAIERYQCGACHEIPGVADARGRVGPPLTAYARRVYIAGKLPQGPALLARWIQDAPSLAPGTAMPNVGVSESDARDMVAYLYRLR